MGTNSDLVYPRILPASHVVVRLHKSARFATIGGRVNMRRFAMSLGVLTFSDPGGFSRSRTQQRFRGHSSFTTFGLWARVKTLSITLTGLLTRFPTTWISCSSARTEPICVLVQCRWRHRYQQPELHHQGLRSLVLPDSGGIASGTYRPADDVSWKRTATGPACRGLVINHPTTTAPRSSMRASAANGSTIRPGSFCPGRCLPGFRHPERLGHQVTDGIWKPHHFNGSLRQRVRHCARTTTVRPESG